jgi:ABC-type cobalamin/Fe3+-siderophores transport system ATPase subunit
VLTKGPKPKQVGVNQLSDGQKHTILLAIAMLAESNLPLIIDQPEDDLDNAFIFDSVVATLRTIKERRQVIVVTHNANIAVLGDSELILPMKRAGDKGTVVGRGSIDRNETKKGVQEILEGGELAFRRRHAIYGH